MKREREEEERERGEKKARERKTMLPSSDQVRARKTRGIVRYARGVENAKPTK